MNDYKDVLFASLYSQVEHLKGELEEKNILIRILFLQDGGRQGDSGHI